MSVMGEECGILLFLFSVSVKATLIPGLTPSERLEDANCAGLASAPAFAHYYDLLLPPIEIDPPPHRTRFVCKMLPTLIS